jgi:hypothetical protein
MIQAVTGQNPSNGLPAARVPCGSRRFARSLNSPIAKNATGSDRRSLNRKTPVMLGVA